VGAADGQLARPGPLKGRSGRLLKVSAVPLAVKPDGPVDRVGGRVLGEAEETLTVQLSDRQSADG